MDGSIGAYEAKTKLAELLDRVERGEEITITRRGVAVARLVPASPAPQMTPEEAVRGLFALREQLRAQGVRVTQAEIREWIEEGRR